MSVYPRVHDCLYNWCPYRVRECETCDAVKRIELEKRVADLARRTSEPSQAQSDDAA